MIESTLIALILKFGLLAAAFVASASDKASRISATVLAAACVAGGVLILAEGRLHPAFAAVSFFLAIGLLTVWRSIRAPMDMIPQGDPGINPLINVCLVMLLLYMVGYPFPPPMGGRNLRDFLPGMYRTFGQPTVLMPHSLAFLCGCMVLGSIGSGVRWFAAGTGIALLVLAILDMNLRAGRSLVPEMSFLVLGVVCLLLSLIPTAGQEQEVAAAETVPTAP